MVVTKHSETAAGPPNREPDAVDEAMAVSLLEKVAVATRCSQPRGAWYEVDVISVSCTCPDWQQRAPEGGCKHIRRVDHEIKQDGSPPGRSTPDRVKPDD